MIEKRHLQVPVTDFVRDCVNVEKFSAYCRACRGYGKTWSCPPFRFKPLELWGNYHTLRLYSRKVPVPAEMQTAVFSAEELNRASLELLRPEKEVMLMELLDLESRIPRSMALSAGSCNGCPEGECTRLTGAPCRNPGIMRYSIEALGGDVSKALELYFHQQLLWGQEGHMPEYYILLGGLLQKANVPILKIEKRS